MELRNGVRATVGPTEGGAHSWPPSRQALSLSAHVGF